MATPSDEVKQDYYNLFHLMDKNGDGFVTTAEIKTLLSKLGQYPTKSQIRSLLKAVDVNNDNKIEYDEFVKYMEHKIVIDSEHAKEDKMLKMFEIFDKDGNGSIDHGELRAIISFTGENITNEEVDAIMQEVDTDNSGSIDFEEFKKMMQVLL